MDKQEINMTEEEKRNSQFNYYKFPASSDTGKVMKKFWQACLNARKLADAFCNKQGAVAYHSDPMGFEGGVAYLVFADPKRVDHDVWREAAKVWDDVCFEPNCAQVPGKRDAWTGPQPLVNGKRSPKLEQAIHIRKQMKKLPIISVGRLYQLLGVEMVEYRNDGFTPRFFVHNGYYFLEIDQECKGNDELEPINFEVFRFEQNLAQAEEKIGRPVSTSLFG